MIVEKKKNFFFIVFFLSFLFTVTFSKKSLSNNFLNFFKEKEIVEDVTSVTKKVPNENEKRNVKYHLETKIKKNETGINYIHNFLSITFEAPVYDTIVSTTTVSKKGKTFKRESVTGSTPTEEYKKITKPFVYGGIKIILDDEILYSSYTDNNGENKIQLGEILDEAHKWKPKLDRKNVDLNIRAAFDEKIVIKKFSLPFELAHSLRPTYFNKDKPVIPKEKEKNIADKELEKKPQKNVKKEIKKNIPLQDIKELEAIKPKSITDNEVLDLEGNKKKDMKSIAKKYKEEREKKIFLQTKKNCAVLSGKAVTDTAADRIYQTCMEEKGY